MSESRWMTASRLLLLGALIGGPLAFGAVETWAWATLALLALGALLAWAIGSAQRGILKIHYSPLYVPAALFLLVGVIQFAGHLTLDPYGTRQSLFKLTADLIFFFLAGQHWAEADERARKSFGLVVAVYAFAMALFAIIQFFSSPIGLIYWHVKTPGGSFGPYVDRDHFAGLMELLVPIALGAALSRPAKSPERTLLIFGVCVAVTSVLLSSSRGGMISLFVELVALGVILWRREKERSGRGRGVLWLIGVAGALALFFAVSPSAVYKRLATVTGVFHAPEVTLGDRLIVSRDALGILHNHFWLGSGLGSFAVAFPRYQTFATNLFWNHAHDDYVEALTETGIVGGALMLASIALFFSFAFRNLNGRMNGASNWIQLGGALGVCGLLVHSFSDFNLHIPANAAWFAVALGIATAPVGDQRGDETPINPR